MTRTSSTHPLQIAELVLGPALGRIGITFCPGKKQPDALTGAWDRNLGIDLDAVEAWGAAAVLTLVEAHELAALSVEGLGDAVKARHMLWLHAPIPDVTAPGEQFERGWTTTGAQVRDLLRSGFNVLVHCKGGLGRAGTIAARLAVELGAKPTQAVADVRQVRPGAIETEAQRAHVLALGPAHEPRPATAAEAIRDRELGCLLGLAVGDAVGTTLEFKARDSGPPLTDMVGGGPFGLKAGQWTDDTAMALALADSLIEHPALDERDLLDRFVRWWKEGDYSCTGACFDIGITTSQALSRWQRSGNPKSGSTDPYSAGNGSLMRLAPVAVRWRTDREVLREVAARQSETTHGAPEAVDACIAYAEILADAIAGRRRSEVLASRGEPYAGKIAAIVAGSWRGLRRAQVRSSGYVAHSLEAALWCVGRTTNFKDAVLLAANLGDDADTTAAITGQLAGALYGASGIPAVWREKLAWAERIGDMAQTLTAAADQNFTDQLG